MPSDYVAIKDFDRREVYADIIEKEYLKYLWEYIYKYLFKAARLNKNAIIKAQNYVNPLLEALKNNEIYYIEGGFRATSKFSSKTAKILRDMGAQWDKYSKTYEIQLDRVPPAVSRYIQRGALIAQAQLMEINNILGDLEHNLDLIIEDMIFTPQVVTILDDAQTQVQTNAREINIIDPELSQKQKDEISRTYTNNMQYYIKNFEKEHIPQMREKVQEIVLRGERQEEVEKFLIRQYNKSAQEAQFLARNETSIMISELKKVYYQDMGFDSFYWNTIMDGRERPLHAKHNGKKYKFSNLPIIDERTGQRGLPGQTYNCRCSLTPVMSDSIFE